MNLKLGNWLTLETKALPPLAPLSGRASWWPWIHESFTGAWQSNVVVAVEDVVSHPTAWACITLIAADIAKNACRLVEEDADGIWSVDRSNSPYWPVLRKPNRYQTRIEFFESWMISKLTRGNTYVLKERADQRGLVTELHVLDPGRVTPLVAPDGAVYYQISRDDLSGQRLDSVTLPARDIIHDRCVALYHPLIGVSPIYASGMAAYQALKIQYNQTKLFQLGTHPGGVLLVPGKITPETAGRIKAEIDGYSGEGAKVGSAMVLSEGMDFKQTGMTAVDTDLIKQLNWSDEKICSTFHVPAFMVGVGPAPPYNNIQAIWQMYYQQCLQVHIEKIEILLDEGLEIATPKGTEFDLDNLMRMDTATLMETLKVGVGAGIVTPDEARYRLNYGSVTGGDTPYMQQQNFSLEALAERDANKPFAKPEPAPTVPAVPEEPDEDDELVVNVASALNQKAIAQGLYAA